LSTTEPLGIETQLWSAADTLRGNVDAAEYKHVVLGLLFLKYISDAFEELHSALESEAGADPEALTSPAESGREPKEPRRVQRRAFA
jgi:type I restriction enzyme M protein